MGFDLLLRDARLPDGTATDIGVAGGLIVALGPNLVGEAAEVIGNACLVRGKRASGLVRMTAGQAVDLSPTLLALRPYAAMLVVSSGDEYIAEMLTALRA